MQCRWLPGSHGLMVNLLVMNTMSTKSFGTRAILNTGHTPVGACNRLAALVLVKPSWQARAYIVVGACHDELEKPNLEVHMHGEIEEREGYVPEHAQVQHLRWSPCDQEIPHAHAISLRRNKVRMPWDPRRRAIL
ncbi:hypothetical protein VNO77_37389 [Canavalia gladiata]|uniref:Uncharacterized protein n=1 Tax=Canavalia gladiata TaxID=3824 RepID=A0AAN9KBF2_CANGL